MGARPIRTFSEFDLDIPNSFNDVQIGLDMHISGLTNYSTKQEVDSRYQSTIATPNQTLLQINQQLKPKQKLITT